MATSLPSIDSVPDEWLPKYEREVEVRIMVGLYDHKLTEEGLGNCGAEWTLTPVADRMGLRFDGPGAPWKDEPQPFGAGQDPSNITDAGYPVGSITYTKKSLELAIDALDKQIPKVTLDEIAQRVAPMLMQIVMMI